MKRKPTRRNVLALAGAAAMTNSLPVLSKSDSASKRSIITARREISSIGVFTKPLVHLSYNEMASKLSALGFDAIEAPVRKSGHFPLEKLDQELPKLVEALAKQGMKISVMATDINDPNDKQSEQLLRTAAKLGIKRYRLKYFTYSDSKPIDEQLKRWKKQLTALAELNREIGIQGLYQNHAGGRYFGAPIWDLASVLESIDPEHLGVAYDIRHGMVEGGMSWRIDLRRILPHIRMLYVKDFRWEEGRVKNVPLGDGQVDRKFLNLTFGSGFQGPVSLHEEYLSHQDPALVPQHLQAMGRDLKVLKGWIKKAETEIENKNSQDGGRRGRR